MQKMGKLNSSIDIIPLQGSSGDFRSRQVENKHRMEQRSFRDQSLIGRVQTYMHENENKVYIDVNEMADSLQRRYRDYRAKKRGAFRAMVRKAYDELTEIFSKKPVVRQCTSTYDDDDDDDDDDFEDVDVEVFRLSHSALSRGETALRCTDLRNYWAILGSFGAFGIAGTL
ncbi:PREDICTED: uncharacterized protein LOC105556500 [Vollenhovia emeryi]|uniref:uncharacterized protein LOC105556500 n=1 Tax=Vollenhovia emeryi TaxID=411798 RepID=UPI0005F39B8B|nr:PREDICTED: uncharacterized protein LOC105556500 [Vollenhovia emeryi]